VFNHYLPYHEADRWHLWLPASRHTLPEPWPDTGERRRLANGDEIELRSRRTDLDPLEQRWTRQIRATLWRDGTVVAQEEHTMEERFFFRNELVLLLRNTGFTDIAVHGGYDGKDSTADDLMLVYIARAGHRGSEGR
jgi:hypothetical protein